MAKYWVTHVVDNDGIMLEETDSDGNTVYWSLPEDPANVMWAAYQEWLAEGNTPTPWPSDPPEEA